MNLIQTMIYNSPFRENLYYIKNNTAQSQACLRYIDWEREGRDIGAPYTFTIDDYESLINSENLFCRKVTDSTAECEALIEKLEQL